VDYKDRDRWERVAWHQNTLPALLALLTRDSEKFVWRGVAENENTPSELLAPLKRDPDIEERVETY